MRVLHVVLTPRHSGAEMLAASLACEHVRGNGFVVGILGINPCEEAFARDWAMLKGAGVWASVPSKRPSRIGRIKLIAAALKSFCPDIVVAHSVIPAAYVRMAVHLSRSTVPVIPVLHAATNDDYSGFVLRLTERLLKHRAASIVTVNELASINYRKRCGKPKRQAIIPNGTAVDQYRFDSAMRRATRASFGVEADTRIVLQVGRLSEVKNQKATLDAVEYLKKNGKPYLLWFAGLTEDIEYEKSLRKQVAQSSFRESVRFLGGRTDIAALLSAADVYVMPSRREAHSIAMIEALASDIPIVASTISVFEFAARFSGVMFVDPRDGVAYASAIASSIEGGRRSDARDVSQYSMTRVAEQYASLFDEVALPDARCR